MKFGLNTAICEGMTFEEVVDFASENGLECLEVACWPQGKASRRYAGVSHIDAAGMDEEKAQEIHKLLDEKNVSISALAYYPNPLDPDLEARTACVDHLLKVIDAALAQVFASDHREARRHLLLRLLDLVGRDLDRCQFGLCHGNACTAQATHQHTAENPCVQTLSPSMIRPMAASWRWQLMGKHAIH